MPAKQDGRYSLAYLVPLVYLLIAGLFALISWQEIAQINDTTRSLARERGAVLFRLIELARDWNARHGGVYVPISEGTQPNPYLHHPRREITTNDGQRLTMINPAYMTRQIAEIAEQADGVRFHITSRKPIRPANQADAWETEALERFENGSQDEYLALIEEGGQRIHRYMAPLFVKEACLKCHEQQGYRVGDVRGGISISMPAEELLKVRDGQIDRTLVRNALSALLIALLVHFIAYRTLRHVRQLRQLNERQESLIAERTQSLAESNAQLKVEIDRQLQATHKLKIAAMAVQNSREGILVTDAQNRIIEVNPGFCETSGFRPEELIGQDPRILASGRHGKSFFASFWQSLQENGSWEGEIWNRRRDGGIFPQWVTIASIRTPGSDDTGARFVATYADITQRKVQEERWRFKAQTDPLTQLPNRLLFEDRLEMALSFYKRYQEKFAVLYLDLDYFKDVNDNFGHAAGDALLIQVAGRLKDALRASDTVARMGGDEFAILLIKQLGAREAEEIAARIVSGLAIPFELSEGTARISCSIGIAYCPEHGEDADTLTRAADQALYQVKAGGRNAYRVFGG